MRTLCIYYHDFISLNKYYIPTVNKFYIVSEIGWLTDIIIQTLLFASIVILPLIVIQISQIRRGHYRDFNVKQASGCTVINVTTWMRPPILRREVEVSLYVASASFLKFKSITASQCWRVRFRNAPLSTINQLTKRTCRI